MCLSRRLNDVSRSTSPSDLLFRNLENAFELSYAASSCAVSVAVASSNVVPGTNCHFRVNGAHCPGKKTRNGKLVTLLSLINFSTIGATMASSAPATLPSFWVFVQSEKMPTIAAVSPGANSGVHGVNTSRISTESANVWAARSMRSNRMLGVKPCLEYCPSEMSRASVCAVVLNTRNVTSSPRIRFANVRNWSERKKYRQP